MAVLFFIIGGICFISAVCIVLADYFYRRRSLRRMYDMIQSAVDGTFRADRYDESLYASVENKLAEYLASSETALGKAAKEKEQIKTLIADISHQTKTPLANILLYTELLKEQFTISEQQPGLQETTGQVSAEELREAKESREIIILLENQAKKLHFLVQSLVKMSKLETGILVLHPKNASVAELLEEIEKQYWDMAHKKGLYFHVMPQEAYDVTACFDEKWTLEALGNLVDNAVKYTQSGGVTVSVKVFGLYVCIEVADTGIGVGEEEHAKVFGRFYRSPRVAGQEGVGIGLYLTREILNQQGGYMKLVSREGAGAVFSMYLPTEERKRR